MSYALDTKEPWLPYDVDARNTDQQFPIHFFGRTIYHLVSPADFERARVSVNALQGIEDPVAAIQAAVCALGNAKIICIHEGHENTLEEINLAINLLTPKP